MKKNIMVIFLLLALAALAGCGEKAKETTTAGGSRQAEMQPSQKFNVGNYAFFFNGYSGKTENGWIASFSTDSNFTVNDYYTVNEGETIRFFGNDIKIVAVDPKKNTITIIIP